MPLPAIADAWKVQGYPTLYLIDHHGVIRKRWTGAPPAGHLEHMVEVLADAAERKVALADMPAVMMKLTPPAKVKE